MTNTMNYFSGLLALGVVGLATPFHLAAAASTDPDFSAPTLAGDKQKDASCVFKQINAASLFGAARVSADHDTDNAFGGNLPKNTVTFKYSDTFILIVPGMGENVPFFKPGKGDPVFDKQWNESSFRNSLPSFADNLRKRCYTLRHSI